MTGRGSGSIGQPTTWARSRSSPQAVARPRRESAEDHVGAPPDGGHAVDDVVDVQDGALVARQGGQQAAATVPLR